MKKILLVAAATLIAPAVFAEPTVGTISKEYQRGDLAGSFFTGTSITTAAGEEASYSLTLPEGNVYFTGEGELTITEITSSSTGGKTSTTDSFIVEGTTVTVSGVEADLGLNLSIGTMESAELVITGGSNISTGAYLNTVGSTMATGTITIEGNSTLSTQQITLGGGISSLFGVDPQTEGAYWVQYLISDDDRTKVIAALTTAYSKEAKVSYGIVNVNSGSTWNVGVGNTDSSTNKLQVSNGEINISGGQLFMSDGSGLILQGESGFTTSDGTSYVTGVNFSQSITVKDGGSVSTSESGDGMFELVLGNSWYASNSTTDVLVSGEDSSFDVTVNAEHSNGYVGVYIGDNSGTWVADGEAQIYDGGTVDVDIKAEQGGVFKVSTYGGIYVAADNYYDYLTSSTADNSGHSYGLTVAFTAASGGSLTLEAERVNLTANMDGVIYLGVGSAADDYENAINAMATGEGSTLVFSAYTIYTNYQSANLATSFVAEKGGSLTIQVQRQVVFGFETSGSNNTLEVKADGGTVLITGADDVYTNYGSRDLTSEFGAYNGGTLTIEAKTEIVFGVGGPDQQRTGTTLYTDGGSATVTADAGTVVISTTGNFFTNYNTTGDFASSFNATNGGSISIDATGGSALIGYTPNSDVDNSAASGTSSFKATGEGSVIDISAKTEVLVGYNASSDFIGSFAAEDGGTIYIQTTDSTNGRIYLGCSEQNETVGGKISVSADGAGSTVGIYAPVEIYVNWNTSGSDFVASDGGSISITAATTSPFAGFPTSVDTNVWLGYGEESTGGLNVTATGTDSDGNASSIEIAATNIYVNSDTTGNLTSNFVASNGGSLTFNASGTSEFNTGTKISITTGGSLSTTATVFNSGSSISIDGTSVWTGGDALFASGSAISITTSANAITLLASESGANVSLEEVLIEEGASITVTIDISSLDDYTSASVAVLDATSIIFDYDSSKTTLGTGSTITGDGYSSTLSEFVSGYITLTEGDFILDSWSYTGNDDGTYTLYANIRTLPEPSMFGLFFGLAAIGLVATRRRRRTA